MKNLLLALLLFSPSVVTAQPGEKNFIDLNYIEVTGKAEKEVVPDKIFIKILLNEKDFKGKSLSEVEKAMFGKLNELGLDLAKDLAIKDLLSNFRHYWLMKDDILLSKEYQLLVNDGKTAGKVFIELQKLGISNVSIDKVENSKITAYRNEVKIAAIKAAQEKAKALAQAISQDIGRAIYIQELETGFMPFQGKAVGINVRGYANTVLDGSGAAEPDIEFEKIKLDYSVIVRFELTPGNIVTSSVITQNGDRLDMSFNNTRNTATFVFKGDLIEMKQDTTASGIRYSNPRYEFTEWHGEIQLKEDGKVIFSHQKN
jgi:uncharacterized protein YggE